ncbi:MAG: FIST C-terminal domain-containing protein [Synergistaceae bacterium]|jgi:hypothetical protein|nr:FIST C-terminal domain-containing protein [Synergistaceae bacterium]
MIRMIGAGTAEIDDPDAAVSEILDQLALEGALLDNSVGIVSCHSEFVETGMLRELCGRLPFDVVGCTALGSSVRGQYGVEFFSISVITSDDVSFSAAYSDPMAEDSMRGPLTGVYDRAKGALPGEPVLAIVFAPYLSTVGGEMTLSMLDEISAHIPLFGRLPSDHTLRYNDSMTFMNGESRSGALGLVLVSGNIKPRFFSGSISENKIQNQNGIITESDGCILRRVNGMPLMKYLTSQGLASGCIVRAFGSIPFLVDYNDGTTPVARAIYDITEEGYAVCGGLMPEGAALAIGSIDVGDILRTADDTLASAINSGGINGMFIFSSFVRCLMLGPDSDDEIKRTMDLIGRNTPYHFAYSGGEILPVYGMAGNTMNRFHNFSYAACVF